MDRASLINDAFALAESGQLDYSIPMAMMQYLKSEQSYVPWQTTILKLGAIESLLRNTDAYPMFRQVSKTYLL